MELDGLRAWIGLVEQKLGKRTRVFLVLVAIAVGGAGAAVYLAIDANDAAVSESDLRATRDELAAQIGTGGGGAELSQLEAEITQLKSEVEALNSGSGAKEGGGGGGKSGGGGGTDGGASGGRPPNNRPEELLEQLRERAQQQ